ncbi:MAG: GIY-YIG nuclease family protein [Muribaculaceae bacterium]|nr:GIY-YIG nuclease family protein [Muribaculaceae bacterium]MDE6346540.1 GIY-YIG nuclease family protein [Muribaculaceae bacterium]
MDQSLEKALKLVSNYNIRYNTMFKPSHQYKLHPLEGEYGIIDNEWPCNHKAGVYLILDKNNVVIYVGQSSSLGYRFYQYFNPTDKIKPVRHKWKGTPDSIIAFSASDTAAYERLSLEEYLIYELSPLDNKRAKNKNSPNS